MIVDEIKYMCHLIYFAKYMLKRTICCKVVFVYYNIFHQDDVDYVANTNELHKYLNNVM